MEELFQVLTKNCVAGVPVRFYFFHYCSFVNLLAANISHFLPVIMKFSSFSSNEICLLCFFITCSSSFSVIHMSVDIKNQIEKNSTFLLFFLSKSLCGHAISCQKHLELPVVSYLLIDLFYIGMPANGRMVNRTGIHSHDYQNFLDRWITNFSITKISRIDGLPIFLRYGAPLARAELQYKDRK